MLSIIYWTRPMYPPCSGHWRRLTGWRRLLLELELQETCILAMFSWPHFVESCEVVEPPSSNQWPDLSVHPPQAAPAVSWPRQEPWPSWPGWPALAGSVSIICQDLGSMVTSALASTTSVQPCSWCTGWSASSTCPVLSPTYLSIMITPRITIRLLTRTTHKKLSSKRKSESDIYS